MKIPGLLINIETYTNYTHGYIRRVWAVCRKFQMTVIKVELFLKDDLYLCSIFLFDYPDLNGFVCFV